MAIDRNYRGKVWKQETPRDQLTVIIGAVMGELSLLFSKIHPDSANRPALERAMALAQEAGELTLRLDPGRWENDHDSV